MLGYDIQDWAKLGVVADLTEVANKEGWDKVVPEPLQKFSKYDGKWIAAPVNIHSPNWIWANKAILDKLGLKEPTNWDELIAALDKIKAAGYVALAVGGQPWQETEIFDNVVLSTGGPEFYTKALIELDPAALASDTMKTVFDRLVKLKSYMDPNAAGRDWNHGDRHGHHRKGRHADHGRLGQGRVHQRQEGGRQGLRLLPLPPAPKGR